ncbi:MAG: serine hydrolase [Chloroflexi bacterium]|nr:serine hydrolase [Chloroflexota bacterium]
MENERLDRLYEAADAYAKYCRPPVHTFLVQHRGEIVAERSWWGYTPTSTQPVFSITKSVVSALVGIALGDGKLALSDTLGQWFPELPAESPSRAITVEHLLTMTGGFVPLKARLTGDDPLPALLNRPLNDPPGQQFHYDNEAVDLLAVLVERAVGEPALDFAVRRLFTPLGIWSDVPKSGRRRLWQADRQKRVLGGYGLHLTTHEMAAFGQLYLQRGCWQGQQIVPVEYVAASTSVQSAGGYAEMVKYGYLWWVTSDRSGHAAFYASGRGGQYIYVVPALELVVVITSTARSADGRAHRVTRSRLAVQYVTEESDGT